MLIMRRSLAIPLFLASSLYAAAQSAAPAAPPQTAADWVEQGRREFAAKQFDQARESGSHALALDPDNTGAKLLLADADQQRWMRLRDEKERQKAYFQARNLLLDVLEHEPDNKKALRRIAQLSFLGRDGAPGQDAAGWLSEARRWNLRLIEVDPAESSGHFALGVLAWTECVAQDGNARSRAGLSGTADGPIPDEKIRDEFREACRTPVEEGAAQLKQAVALKPGDAMYMRYLALMLRFRSDYAASPEAARPDLDLAKQLESKAEELNPRGNITGR